jgi:hypothetical protein
MTAFRIGTRPLFFLGISLALGEFTQVRLLHGA